MTSAVDKLQCDAVAVRLVDGGEFLIWAAGRERPDEGLAELFSVDHEGVRYAGAVARGDKIQAAREPRKSGVYWQPPT